MEKKKTKKDDTLFATIVIIFWNGDDQISMAFFRKVGLFVKFLESIKVNWHQLFV